MDRTDEALIHASLNGEPEAFELLLPRYERKVFGLLLRMSGRSHDAQDLFQVVWMQAFAGRASFKNKAKFSTWLYAITLNQVREWRRKKAKERARTGEMPVDPADDKIGFLDRLLKRDQEQKLRAALQKLNPADQEVLALYYLQDLDYDELAIATGKKVGPLRVQVHRALQKLRTVMGSDEA